MISINQRIEDPEKVRYIKEESGKVRKMYVRKIEMTDGTIVLQKTAEPRPSAPIYIYQEHTTYFSEAEAETGKVSRLVKKL